jgi:hypothetical protein
VRNYTNFYCLTLFDLFLFSFVFLFTDLKAKFGEVAREVQVEEGAELRLPCQPPEGFPAPTIYWEKDGATLINDDYFVIEPSGDLVIDQAGLEDVGSYVCLASNGGEATRRDAPIIVHVTRRAVVIDRRVSAEIPPSVVEAFMLDSVTGLVHWRPLADAAGYVVRVTANNGLEVTNISVEADVTQVKLHSLDPGLTYRVQVAGLYGGGRDGGMASGHFSPPRQLSAKTHEVILVDNSGVAVGGEEIPLKVWAIAMAVVILVTLTIVLAAALLCYKSRRGAAGGRHACSDYYDTRHAGGSHYGWLDGRWGIGGNGGGAEDGHDDGDSPTTSFRSNNRLLQLGNAPSAGQYDYAVPTMVMAGSGGKAHFAAAGSGGKAQYGGSGGKGQYGGGGSNHYASNTILKPAYYEPLNARGRFHQPANLSFDSDYKTPLDSGSHPPRR